MSLEAFAAKKIFDGREPQASGWRGKLPWASDALWLGRECWAAPSLQYQGNPLQLVKVGLLGLHPACGDGKPSLEAFAAKKILRGMDPCAPAGGASLGL